MIHTCLTHLHILECMVSSPVCGWSLGELPRERIQDQFRVAACRPMFPDVLYLRSADRRNM
jgi:hypothetical protein